MVKLGKPRSGVAGIWIRHRRVFTHNVHAVNLARMHGIHDFNDREAGIWIEFLPPKVFEALTDRVVSDRAIVREDHWNEASI